MSNGKPQWHILTCFPKLNLPNIMMDKINQVLLPRVVIPQHIPIVLHHYHHALQNQAVVYHHHLMFMTALQDGIANT